MNECMSQKLAVYLGKQACWAPNDPEAGQSACWGRIGSVWVILEGSSEAVMGLECPVKVYKERTLGSIRNAGLICGVHLGRPTAVRGLRRKAGCGNSQPPSPLGALGVSPAVTEPFAGVGTGMGSYIHKLSQCPWQLMVEGPPASLCLSFLI